MPEKFRELMTQDFSALAEVATAWTRMAEALLEAQEESYQRVSAPLIAADWTGQAATSGLRSMEVAQSILHTAAINMTLMATALRRANRTMQIAQVKLRSAVEGAEADGFTVREDGWVLPRELDPEMRNDPDYERLSQAANAGLGEYRRQIEQAVADATSAAVAAAGVLRDVDWFTFDKEYGRDAALELAARMGELMDIGANVADIPEDGTPDANARWWNGMSQSQREAYLLYFPAEVGALDGLPTPDRDIANRRALDALLEEYAAREHTHGIHDGMAYAGLTHLREQLDLAAGAEGDKQLYLLGFDTSHDGQYVLAQGNPDTAAHTAILVPGTGTDMTSAGGQIARIDRMQASAMERTDQDVAVISWLGYDAPEIPSGVATTGRANAGAADLRDFTAGLAVANTARDNHLTVVGHSYGSTMVGAADRGGDGLGADDIIVVGSPGMTVGKARDLNIDPEHLWVGMADDDPIPRHFGDQTLGVGPHKSHFGAQQMYVDTSGHSGYWTEGSESLKNIGRIIAGVEPSLETSPR
ncbi:alpha/beta hydrolase family protein [Streptomyces sp. G-5]|uniref:alpha/beta hydrolase family protein n=1 Tax=Streptomyces sp. G-5 TaxID=2977231 RepID=UPI0021CEB968|nr:alpha/beta hydrolase family protein [Streptomyces sp. G-5]MCU4747552.1 alpha/beta hydrolase family protein [Streptomyces sp. G-5]